MCIANFTVMEFDLELRSGIFRWGLESPSAESTIRSSSSRAKGKGRSRGRGVRGEKRGGGGAQSMSTLLMKLAGVTVISILKGSSHT